MVLYDKLEMLLKDIKTRISYWLIVMVMVWLGGSYEKINENSINYIGYSSIYFSGFYIFKTPETKSIDAPDGDFSAERAMETVESIAKVPHPMGSKENIEVRDYLINELKSLGLNSEIQRTFVKNRFEKFDLVKINRLILMRKLVLKVELSSCFMKGCEYSSR